MTHKNTNQSDFNRKAHWEEVYSVKQSTEVSWYQQHPEKSLELIKTTVADTSSRIIDIGGGASTLVDFLLNDGYQNLCVLDIAHSAIEQAKTRLAEKANEVNWLEQDITEFSAEQPYDLWHDRAVFHFLTHSDDRTSYIQTLSKVLKPGSHAIIATFGLDGPEKCSGLEVVRYSPETLSATLGNTFKLEQTSKEEHATPSGATQSFVYCTFLKVAE